MSASLGVQWAARALGGLLLFSGFVKIGDPQGFADAVAGFRLLPTSGNAWLAAVLPWWELAAGGLLLAGFWTRSSACVAACLFGAFSFAVASALFRGLDVQCGCFGKALQSHVRPELLAFDLLAMAAAAWVAVRAPSGGSRPRRDAPGAVSPEVRS